MDKQTASLAATWSFGRLLRDVPVPEKYRGSLRKKQLDTVSNMIFVMLLANLLNVAVILQSFRHSSASNLLAIWGFCFIFLTGLAVLRHIRTRKAIHAGLLSQRHADAVSRGALIIGLFWAVLPLLVMHAIDPQGQMVMGIVLAGMMFGGAFMLSRMPDAAFSLIIPIGIGLTVSMQLQHDITHQLISVMALVYLSVLIFAVRWSHLQFVEQHLSEAAVQDQTQLIGLLLRDF
ncbi:MAG: hypothetical protein Q8S09_11295, partial [Hyphomonas sp.]|nr:hypothetical protein [Hyphomonas sp.]